MKNVLVFCSAQELEEKYIKPAEEFARLLGENGYHLVWGGSETGLMKNIAHSVRKSGGKLIGISMELLRHVAMKDADEMIIAKDLGERKATMLKRSDAIVMLAGGIGTLDEITEVLELKKHGIHNKPIVILNTENFYEGLKMQLQKMKDDGFIPQAFDELVYFADTPQEAIDYIKTHI